MSKKDFKLFLVSFVSLTLLSMTQVGCSKRVVEEKHIHHKDSSPTNPKPPGPVAHGSEVQGTETHGGNVTPSVMMNIYEAVTQTAEDIREKLGEFDAYNKDIEEAEYRTIKGRMMSLWKGIELYYKKGSIKNYGKNRLQQVVEYMLKGNEKGNIFDDIQNSKLDVKFEKRLQWMDSFRADSYTYGDCIDIHKQESAASAKMGDVGGDICVSATLLAEQVPDEDSSKIWGILSHEYAHHFDFGEQDSVDLQNFIGGSNEGLGSKMEQLGLQYYRTFNLDRKIKTEEYRSDNKIDFMYRVFKTKRLKLKQKKYQLKITYQDYESGTDVNGTSSESMSIKPDFSVNELVNVWGGRDISVAMGYVNSSDCKYTTTDNLLTIECAINNWFKWKKGFPVLGVSLVSKENESVKLPYSSASIQILEDGQPIKDASYQVAESEIEEKGLEIVNYLLFFE